MEIGRSKDLYQCPQYYYVYLFSYGRLLTMISLHKIHFLLTKMYGFATIQNVTDRRHIVAYQRRDRQYGRPTRAKDTQTNSLSIFARATHLQILYPIFTVRAFSEMHLSDFRLIFVVSTLMLADLVDTSVFSCQQRIRHCRRLRSRPSKRVQGMLHVCNPCIPDTGKAGDH